MRNELTETEQALIDADRDIGGMSDTNAYWFYGLARLVEQTGKQVDELTVRELRQLIKQRNNDFNHHYGAA